MSCNESSCFSEFFYDALPIYTRSYEFLWKNTPSPFYKSSLKVGFLMGVHKLVFGVETKPPVFFSEFFYDALPIHTRLYEFLWKTTPSPFYISSLKVGFLMGLHKLVFGVKTKYPVFFSEFSMMRCPFIHEFLWKTTPSPFYISSFLSYTRKTSLSFCILCNFEILKETRFNLLHERNNGL